jgi:fibronectin-binding autotransporter adhesin
VVFITTSSAANASITANGSTVSGAEGGLVGFIGGSRADSATLIANGGANGGEGGFIQFSDNSSGGTARVEVFDTGNLDISDHDAPGLIVGSLEGDGLVFLGAQNLSIGSNGSSTVFSGIIQDGGMGGGTGGSVIKIGAGTLTLSGANTYTGGTTVRVGALKVSNTSGSGTGSGAVQVDAGTLSGKGIIAGAVTMGTGSGTGAFLAPSSGARQPSILTIHSSLTFKADSTYTYKLNTKKATADKVVANGVTIRSGAQFSFLAVANRKLTNGEVFSVIRNTAATPIAGTFTNLPDGAKFTHGRNTFQVSY